MKTPSFELLEVLIAAAESKNLYQAADKLKVSQGLVSLKLKELETQAPLPIFSYEGKRKVLTHYGRELYGMAKAQQHNMAEAFEVLNRTYASAENLTIKIGARRELFEALSPQIDFKGKVHFIHLSNTEAVSYLLDHKIDVAISYELPDSTEIIAKKILESTAHLLVHKRYLNKKSDFIKDKDFLTNTPCVLYSEDGHVLRDWIDYLNIPFEKLHVRGVVEDWRSVQSLVDQKWGYGIVPSYIQSTNPEVISVPLPTSVLPKYIFYALFHKELKKVPAFKALLEFKI
jgi:DNA-binding transcriptional LysR family regulator